MKILLGIVLLVLFSTSVTGQNLKALDEKYGFKEAKFEMPFSSFKNLEKVNPQSPEYHSIYYEMASEEGKKMYDKMMENYYKVNATDLHIGDFSLNKICYNFYKGQLFEIEISVSKGLSNTEGVLKVLETAYGKADKQGENYIWEGEKVSMSYKLNEYHTGGTISMKC